MIRAIGKCGISAKMIADSVSHTGIRIMTMELKYPRFIHSELMTHRVFSRNASSSRAIPVEKMISQVETNPAEPVFWGSNKPGMQAGQELSGFNKSSAVDMWKDASEVACVYANKLVGAGLHKQISNRVLEPWQYMKTIVTSTEWDNFFTLRCHEHAQPEIHELADLMRKIAANSDSVELRPGEFHAPYFRHGYCDASSLSDMDKAIRTSVASCARVSYKNHDGSEPDVAKDSKLYDMLLTAGHMSPFEHVATPLEVMDDWVDTPGVTHQDTKGQLWSGNFRGWSQHRQIIS